MTWKVRMNVPVSRVSAGLLGTVLFAATPPAMAYVGPGAGLGVLGAMLAIGAAVLATLLGLVLWPIRLIRRRRKGTPAATVAGSANAPLQEKKID